VIDRLNPIIVQGDKTILLEVANEKYEMARDLLAGFAELEKSPEHIHSYRITPLSLWNAASSGITAENIIKGLEEYSKYDVPENIRRDIIDYISRYGRVKLINKEGLLLLVSYDRALIAEIGGHKKIKPYIKEQISETELLMNSAMRGHIKQALVLIGYPAEDLAGYIKGEDLSIKLLPLTKKGREFTLRHYQIEAAELFYAGGSHHGGCGTIVLPCGAGKTMVGMSVMDKLQCSTLILTPSTVAVRQWISELLEKTSLSEEQIGEYTGLRKEICPVTVSTYQVMTYRKRKYNDSIEEFPHFKLFNAREWGLIIYDEVHLLPAPVFRITAELQSRRRLGLTATLIREDRREGDVFSLIGPKKYDVPWKDLEKQGWIATAECYEIRIHMSEEDRLNYALAEGRDRYYMAANNRLKISILEKLLRKHSADNLIIIGMYIEQLEYIASIYTFPIITGRTPVRERERLFEQFRKEEIKILVVSKVGNFSIDLPDANVIIEVSGTFGSRQEEAQRLGRILRPKSGGAIAHFYTLVTRDTIDQDYAANRQRFLTEQGYKYNIFYDNEI